MTTLDLWARDAPGHRRGCSMDAVPRELVGRQVNGRPRGRNAQAGHVDHRVLTPIASRQEPGTEAVRGTEPLSRISAGSSLVGLRLEAPARRWRAPAPAA